MKSWALGLGLGLGLGSAVAQTVPTIGRSGAATGKPTPAGTAVALDSDVARAVGTKQDYQDALGNLLVAQLSQRAGLVGPTGTQASHQGTGSYPDPGGQRMVNGRIHNNSQTGSWGDMASLFTSNDSCPGQNNGPMGGFWDRNSRSVYPGSDHLNLFLLSCARLPEVPNGSTADSFGTVTIVTPTGNETVFTVHLAVPLTLAQIADAYTRPPNLRLEEVSTGAYAYLIDQGAVDPYGNSIPPISADGSTLVVDGWNRGSQYPGTSINTPGVVPFSATPPFVQPSTLGAGPYTVKLDVTHEIGLQYGGYRLQDGDGVNVAVIRETAVINNRSAGMTINLFDPLSGPLLAMGDFEGVGSDNGTGVGIGLADKVCTSGWIACFVARNQPNAFAPNTYGFVAPYAGPNWALYSTQGSGFWAAVDPGNSCGPAGQQAVPGALCTRTVLGDVMGNLALAGRLNAASVYTALDMNVGTNLVVQGTASLTGPILAATTSFRSSLTGGQSAYVDGLTGNFFTNGRLQSALATPTQGSQCFAGQQQDDASYHYVCVAANTWKRVALSSF